MTPRLVAPLLGIVLMVALFPGTWRLDAVARGSLGPGFWPRLALIGLALACLAKLIEEWRRQGAAAAGDPPPPFSAIKLAAGIGGLVGYVLLALVVAAENLAGRL